MIRALLAAALLCAGPAAAQAPGQAQAARVAALDWLAGSWRGSGTMFGNRSEAALTVRPVLGGRFLEFSYSAGPFEGRAFYHPVAEAEWRASWFDNRGVTFPITARVERQQLISDWGSAETERGRTVYRLGPDGLHVIDSVRRPDGSYRDFATHILTRAQ